MDDQALNARLLEAIRREDGERIRALVVSAHPADLAQFLDEAQDGQAWPLLGPLDDEQRGEIFSYLSPSRQDSLCAALPVRQLGELILHLPPDDRADLFNRLEPERQQALLPALAQAERDDILALAAYEEDTAGAVMTSDYATILPQLTAREAIEMLRYEAPDKETIYQAFVVDNSRRLRGAVSLKDLIIAPAGALVEDLMTREVIRARARDDQEEVARQIRKYDLIAMPVVDDADRLLGIVTYDDAMDVAEEEATEDFHKSGTIGKLMDSVGTVDPLTLYRKRIVWLVVLVFANLLTGLGISLYEETIAAYVVLVFFLPLIIGSAGNAGAQSATLMVRALATGEVCLGDWGRLLGRELLVATLLGLTMGLAVSLVGIFRGGPEIALVTAIAMLLVVLMGSVVGMSLPFVLSRLRLDPATASAPLVTSLADVVGVLIYLAVASSLLGLPAPR